MGWRDAPLVDASPAWSSAPETDAPADGQPSGLPDLGPLNALRSQFLRGLTKDGSDEAVGAAFAMSDRHDPDARLRLPDGTLVPIPTRMDAYRAGRNFLRQEQKAADQHWPKLGFAAQMGGELASDYVIGGARAAQRGYQTVAGLARGFLGSNAELTPDQATAGDVGSAALSSLFGGAVGNLAPVVVNRIAQSGPVQYLGGKADEAAAFLGGKLKDAAGWLKVNSLHPVPTLGEKMAALPGGTSAVGRELLERGIGGFTKSATAKQAAQAKNQAGAALDVMVAAYDSAGGAPINIEAALAKGVAAAQELWKQPTTREAAKQVAAMVRQYRKLFEGRSVGAAEALEAKRALGKAVYGAEQELKKSGKTLMGDVGRGLAKFERAIDEQLDAALGPSFGAANLSFRRLLGASTAAKRTAARQQTNLLALGLQNVGGASVGAALAGGPGAAAGLLGTTLLRKYGSQAGARTLHGFGSLLQATPRAAGQLSQGLARGPAPQSRAMTLADLLAPEPEPPLLPYVTERE